MLITIISKCGDYPQTWTFDIRPDDLQKLMTKYDGRGESVLLDTDELPPEIRNYYK